jgi:hypothetical protein
VTYIPGPSLDEVKALKVADWEKGIDRRGRGW